MKIIILTAVTPLPNGRYLPRFSLVEPVGNLYKVIPYSIAEDRACDTEQEAWLHAKQYGTKEAMKEHGYDIEITVIKNNLFPTI